jgi:hypothetical protein
MRKMEVTVPENIRGFISVSLVYSDGEKFSSERSTAVCKGFDLDGPSAVIPLDTGGVIAWDQAGPQAAAERRYRDGDIFKPNGNPDGLRIR